MTNLSKEDVFKNLSDRGAVKAVVHFSGGGDEGGVDQIELYGSDGNVIRELEETWDSTTWNSTTQKLETKTGTPPDGILANALGQPVYDKYYSFAGEFHVNGTVTWDVKTKKVKMSGEERVESYE